MYTAGTEYNSTGNTAEDMLKKQEAENMAANGTEVSLEKTAEQEGVSFPASPEALKDEVRKLLNLGETEALSLAEGESTTVIATETSAGQAAKDQIQSYSVSSISLKEMDFAEMSGRGSGVTIHGEAGVGPDTLEGSPESELAQEEGSEKENQQIAAELDPEQEQEILAEEALEEEIAASETLNEDISQEEELTQEEEIAAATGLEQGEEGLEQDIQEPVALSVEQSEEQTLAVTDNEIVAEQHHVDIDAIDLTNPEQDTIVISESGVLITASELEQGELLAQTDQDIIDQYGDQVLDDPAMAFIEDDQFAQIPEETQEFRNKITTDQHAVTLDQVEFEPEVAQLSQYESIEPKPVSGYEEQTVEVSEEPVVAEEYQFNSESAVAVEQETSLEVDFDNIALSNESVENAPEQELETVTEPEPVLAANEVQAIPQEELENRERNRQQPNFDELDLSVPA